MATNQRTTSSNQTSHGKAPKGVLLLIGGHEDKSAGDAGNDEQGMEILREFISLTNKKSPKIEVVTTASAEGAASFDDYKKAFGAIGVEDVSHLHHDKRMEVLLDDVGERIRQADGIFFSGGDQLKLTSVYGGTSFIETLKSRYINESLVLAGTSAGAMAFSTPMLFAGSKEKQQLAGGVKMATGLGFLNSVGIDTHFVDRSRFVRMAQLIAMNPTSIGLGIEENTAIVIKNGKQGTIIGNGIVIVIDGRGITESNILDYDTGKLISIRDLNVKLLSKGEHYEIPISSAMPL